MLQNIRALDGHCCYVNVKVAIFLPFIWSNLPVLGKQLWVSFYLLCQTSFWCQNHIIQINSRSAIPNPVADPAARSGGGGKNHEIYAAAFSGHPFYDLFLQGRGPWPPCPSPGSATETTMLFPHEALLEMKTILIWPVWCLRTLRVLLKGTDFQNGENIISNMCSQAS